MCSLQGCSSASTHLLSLSGLLALVPLLVCDTRPVSTFSSCSVCLPVSNVFDIRTSVIQEKGLPYS